MTKVKKKVAAEGAVVFSGRVDTFNASFQVGVADGRGGVKFGSEASVRRRFRLSSSGDERSLTQVGGLTAHDTDFARERIAAWQRAVEMADAFDLLIASGQTQFEAFKALVEASGGVTFTYEEADTMEGWSEGRWEM